MVVEFNGISVRYWCILKQTIISFFIELRINTIENNGIYIITLKQKDKPPRSNEEKW